MGESERGGDIAPRARISYWCANGHETQPVFAVIADFLPPERWECPKCGFPAGLDPTAPPSPLRNEPYKTHLAYVKERRSDEEGAALLDEALAVLRRRRGEVA
ncbi:hypothetical protein Xcel_1552 [Xylanimonas cellulosilytica DSM 15894]|uniref:RNA polymerase-binding protein RbpA n=2 Tax=Xylanimonas TaxID=186188 RepID=D1BS90_XYLCX|nr:hypothetical protein Xcel_1552 [Xylanimonas cellulosilytica DSM 15894]